MRILAALAVAVALLLGLPGEGAIRLPSIKNKLIELALDQISSPGSFEITVEGIEDSPDGGTSLLGLAVSDGEGVWLRAERFTFAWQPARLAAGELAIDRLEMAGLHVLRPPAPGAEPPELKPQPAWRRGFFDWPRAPIAVVIAEMRIIGARIEAGVLARPLAFDAEGHAFDRGPLQEIALAVRRTDEVPGRIEVELRRDFDAGTARLALRAEEGPDGLVAAYAGLPAESATRLELVGDGPPEDWRLTLAGKADQVIEAEGTARLAWAERLAARAELRLVPGPALAPAVRDALGERATLDLDVEEAAGGVIAVRAARLASAALEAEATGRFARTAGPGGAETDLALRLAATGALVAFTEAVAFERLGFEGRFAGQGGAVVVEIEVFDGVVLDSEISPERGASIGITLQKDI